MEVAEKATKRTAIFDHKGIAKQRKLMLRSFLFRLGLIKMLPLGFLAGLKITRLDDEGCDVTVPYKFLNFNPFKTTYWAVLGMAAEMASGAILLNYARNIKPSVATFVVGCDSKFVNRALTKVTFSCNDTDTIKQAVLQAAETGEAVTFETSTNGVDASGQVVAEFTFSWSVKGRSK